MGVELSSNEDRDGNYVPAGNYEAFVAYKDWMGREYSSSDRVPVTIRRFVYIHSGMHGPMVATDVEGGVVWRRSYEPFGGDGLFEGSSYEDTYNKSPGLVNLGFVGRQFDTDVGLYQLGHRWYDPEAGRFVSIDPILSSLNVYQYGNNNPFRYSDASGLLFSEIMQATSYAAPVSPAGIILHYNAKNPMFDNGVAFVDDLEKEYSVVSPAVHKLLNMNINTAAYLANSDNAAISAFGYATGSQFQLAQSLFPEKDTDVAFMAMILYVTGGANPNAIGRAGSGEVSSAGGQLTKNTCGPACGQRLLADEGASVYQSNLTGGWYRGLTPENLAANMNKFSSGWKGHMGYPTSEQLVSQSSKGRFIARLGGNNGHFVAVDSISNGTVRFWDPAGGVFRSQSLSEFTKAVSGLVYK